MRSESCGGLSHRSSAKIIISASVRVRLGLSDVNFIRQTVYVYLQWSMVHADTMLRQAMEYVHVWNISTQNPEKVHVFSQLFVQEYIQENSVKVGHRWGVFSSSLMSTYMHASLSLTWSQVHVLSINLAFQSCIYIHINICSATKNKHERFMQRCAVHPLPPQMCTFSHSMGIIETLHVNIYFSVIFILIQQQNAYTW